MSESTFSVFSLSFEFSVLWGLIAAYYNVIIPSIEDKE